MPFRKCGIGKRTKTNICIEEVSPDLFEFFALRKIGQRVDVSVLKIRSQFIGGRYNDVSFSLDRVA